MKFIGLRAVALLAVLSCERNATAPTPVTVQAARPSGDASTAVAAPSTRESAPREQKNILVFVSDDHSPDIGAYGNAIIKTPNLDRLAAEGVRFDSAFATTASCSASRSVILSGLHNHRTGQYGHNHDFHKFNSHEDIKSLPVLLQEAGYRTAISGKFHVGPVDTYRFETRFRGPPRNPVKMAEAVRGFIDADDDRPFFLYFATYDPHRGGRIGSDGEPVGLDDFETPDTFGNRPEGHEEVIPITYDPASVVVPPFLPDDIATRTELAHYYQSVSRLDQGMGRLLQILEETGEYENTLIIYLSDHGIAFPGAKTTTYEPGLRAPLIVRHPGRPERGVVNNAMVSWVDITPTILDFAGVEAPTYELQIALDPVRTQMEKTHGLHGRSFLPILYEATPAGWDEIYASHTFHEIQMYYPMRVVRGRRYKLIWNIAHELPYPFAADLWESPSWQAAFRSGEDARYGARTVGAYIHRPEFELYDLERDPNETHNLAQSERYKSTLAEHQDKLKAFQRRTQDPWILKWSYE